MTDSVNPDSAPDVLASDAPHTPTHPSHPSHAARSAPPASNGVHVTHDELIGAFDGEVFSVQSLFRFCFIPSGRLKLLRTSTADEGWGTGQFALLKYLAVHLRLAIEQGRYVWNGNQIVLTAGRLASPTGVPLYVGLVPNQANDTNPWVLNWVGERPSSATLPASPELGDWPAHDWARELVVACDFSSSRRTLLPEVGDASCTAQNAAVTGAIHWAIHRGLAVRQLHAGGHGYFAPVYLRSRDDLTKAPDFAAPLLVQDERLIARTLLSPDAAYAPARAIVERREQLPAWLLDAWDGTTTSDEPCESGAGNR